MKEYFLLLLRDLTHSHSHFLRAFTARPPKNTSIFQLRRDREIATKYHRGSLKYLRFAACFAWRGRSFLYLYDIDLKLDSWVAFIRLLVKNEVYPTKEFLHRGSLVIRRPQLFKKGICRKSDIRVGFVSVLELHFAASKKCNQHQYFL